MKGQYAVIGKLIARKKGATAAELIAATFSTAVHKRMSEMRARGWAIKKEAIPGRTYHRYFGTAPQQA